MKKKVYRRPGSSQGARASLLMLSASVAAVQTSVAQSDETRNWVDFTVGGSLLSGDEGAFRQRTQTPTDFFGGVSDFHYETDVGKKGLLEIDGRGIFNADDYAITLKYSNPDYGYLRAGFEQYNTYYNGKGGYFPSNGQFFRLPDNELTMQRGKAFFEAGLTLEDKPEIRFRYAYDYRDGTKDSTMWGESAMTGGAGARKIAPSWYNIDEGRHSIALDVAHTIDPVKFGIGGRLELSDYDNRRYMWRSPGLAGTERMYTHREGIETGLYNTRAFVEVDVNERVKVTTGYSFTALDTDLSGARSIGAGPDPDPSLAALRAFPNRQQRDHGFFGLSGGTRLNQHVANVSAMWRITDHLTFVPALKIEDQSQDGIADAFDLEVGGPPARAVADPEHVRNMRHYSFLEVTESAELRYTGVTNWVFYVKGEVLHGDGDVNERETLVEDTTASLIARTTESTRFTQKYAVGANWYPTRRVNAAAQYYHKRRQNEYNHLDETPGTDVEPTAPAYSNGNLYPAFITEQSFVTDDVNFRVTVRPLTSLSFVTRYDFQYSTIDSAHKRRPEVESAESMAHIITESVTWSPIARMYIQGSASYTIDRLTSPGNFVVPRVQVSRNDYLTVSGQVGFALTDKTDLTAGYAYFLADNYDPSIFVVSMPYNRSLEEHTISAGVTHRINKNLSVIGRYAFMTSDDETAGGYANFDAHILSTTLRWRF